ncbi:uncharacterized protein F5147DRAFT_683077 [Suillus discolor]|uniref:Uncharacterized protein n=1 Tax=Suillus discolor TaxID=1912936 RepID=A0A9P7JWV0_9AGAM|nr:uncharacterized protein F5147DRAFT_683077 [Suillus discolor]KAG2113179.1 hypothetical protein F5147DRAFT_683077 [Suillus discolor]
MVHQPSRRRTRPINSQYLPRSVFISTWISTAMLLAIFDISKAVENGVGITPELNPSSGSISLALRKPLRSFSRMLITKRTRITYT